MTVSIIFVIVSAILCAGVVFVFFSKDVKYSTRLIVDYSGLTGLGICNICVYCFGNHLLFNFIIGLILIIESTLLSCIVIHREVE